MRIINIHGLQISKHRIEFNSTTFNKKKAQEGNMSKNRETVIVALIHIDNTNTGANRMLISLQMKYVIL